MPQVYGKKSRVVLQKDFFNNTPEPRRSPRLRKVLVEQSPNIQRLDSSPPILSPCAHKTRQIKIQQQDSIYENQDDDEDSNDDEPVKQPARRRQVARSSGKEKYEDDSDTEALAKALGLLDLQELKDLATSRTTEDEGSLSQSRSDHTPDLSSSSTSSLETAQPISIPQHPVKLKPEIQAYVSPLLECKNFSQTVESFDGWVAARLPFLTFSKIGEGSYGQVFRATDASGATVIIKLMPLNAAKGRRWQNFTSVDSAATEVKLLAKMQKVPGFVEFRGACVLQGSMPEPFMVLWDEYRDAGRTVESRDPRIKGTYPSTQLWLMLEMSDAGTNLEPGHYLPFEALEESTERKPKAKKSQKKTWADRGKYLAVGRVWDIFWQVVFAVAKAEAYCCFEHRDLHLGNICVKDTGRSGLAISQQTNRKYFALPMPVTSTGTTITIIDYTLSRADASSSSSSSSSDSKPMAFDFQADACLLSGEGDLQYDMYRWMDEVIGDRGCYTFDPRTNVVWFYHLLVKLLDMTIPLTKATASDSEPKSDEEAEATDTDTDSNSSEEDLGEDSEMFRSETAEQAMLRVLGEVRALTDPNSIRTWVANSAADLLQHAFAKDWLLSDAL